MPKAFWSRLGIAFTKGKSSVYGDEPARLLRMNACDAAGLGRKIEVEGKKMTHPLCVLTAIMLFRLRI